MRQGRPWLLISFFASSACILLTGSCLAVTLPAGVVDVPGTLPKIEDHSSIRDGTTVNLHPGGTIGWYVRANNGSIINVHGGIVSNGFHVRKGSKVNVLAGDLFSLNTIGEINFEGGTLRNEITARIGAVVNISGGTVGGYVKAWDDAIVNLRGGTVGILLRDFYSQLNIFGSEFEVNGVATSVSQLSVSDDDVLTGTLEDGSPFIFHGTELNSFEDTTDGVTLIASSIPNRETGPFVVHGMFAPRGLRAGQTLTLKEEGILQPNFAAVNATLNIEGGLVEGGLEVYNTEVNVSGGLLSNARLSYSAIQVYAGSTVTIVGKEFYLDQQPISHLANGDAVEVFERDVVLTGILADGNPFSYELTSLRLPGRDHLSPDATLRLKLIPEPTSLPLLLTALFLWCFHRRPAALSPSQVTRIADCYHSQSKRSVIISSLAESPTETDKLCSQQ